MSTKKCIVLDLDNTLWGGIVGEDGVGGIDLSLSGRGAGFIAFQQALLDMRGRGVLLAINSRNNPEDALAVIRSHPNMILKEEHFAAALINWADKADNVAALAEELNIGLDSMVFFDDDPVNRLSVKTRLPAVEVPDLPDSPEAYASFLLSLPYFPNAATTNEDMMRGNLYVTERLRREAEKAFENREAFLHSLGMRVEIFVNDRSAIPRLSQLTEKTNQFNTKKQPLSETDITHFMQDPNYKVFHARALDRFGDHGIIAFALARKEGETWSLDSLLMSCRVIGRGIEDAFISFIAQALRGEDATHLSLAFAKTEKNAPAEVFMKKYFSMERVPIDAVTAPPSWIHLSYGNI